MHGGSPCERDACDAQGFCVCHSERPDKDVEAFARQIETMLSQNKCDFTRFVFPDSADFVHRDFEAPVWLADATFWGPVTFEGAQFRAQAEFRGATFQREANFVGVSFQTPVDFHHARFHGETSFRDATFVREAVFKQAAFQGRAVFSSAQFRREAQFQTAVFRDADFSRATFQGDAAFDSATFEGAADFSETAFHCAARFLSATFQSRGDFDEATFQSQAFFHLATFEGQADFMGATFTGIAVFRVAMFRGTVHFSDAQFHGEAHFVGSDANGVFSREPELEADFSSAHFDQPEKVVFQRVFLGQARFVGADVRRLDFTDVKWATRPLTRTRCAVWDELAPEVEDEPKDYALIGKLYRQLKHNYEEQRDHITAGDFHFGEMHMRRLSNPWKNGFWRFLKRNLSFLAFYRWISGYGEDYILAGLWIIGVIVAFSLAFAYIATFALQPSPASAASLPMQNFWSRFWYSLMCFLLRGDRPLQPMHPAGHYLSVAEGVIGPPLIALFILALNRRFKR